MILGFKQTFPNGMPTAFMQKIINGEKIHSIREGYRWREGLSIQMAYGVRTKNYMQFNKDYPELSQCRSTQKIKIELTEKGALHLIVDGRLLGVSEYVGLIGNDGLSIEQFLDWFLPYGKREFFGQIIHWTNFKY